MSHHTGSFFVFLPADRTVRAELDLSRVQRVCSTFATRREWMWSFLRQHSLEGASGVLTPLAVHGCRAVWSVFGVESRHPRLEVVLACAFVCVFVFLCVLMLVRVRVFVVCEPPRKRMPPSTFCRKSAACLSPLMEHLPHGFGVTAVASFFARLYTP